MASPQLHHPGLTLNETLKNGLIVLVSLVWAANFGASLAVPGYTSDASIHAVFMATVGGLFALGGKSDKGGDAK